MNLYDSLFNYNLSSCFPLEIKKKQDVGNVYLKTSLPNLVVKYGHCQKNTCTRQ